MHLIMDIAIQNWLRHSFFPAFLPFQILDWRFWDQWESDFFASLATMLCYRPYLLPNSNGWESGMSEVRMEKERFIISLDVKHFSPDELSVKVDDDYITVYGKHEERQDEHGCVTRESFRRYKVPARVDPRTFTSCLSADGMLSICALWKLQDDPERSVTITCEDKVAAPK